MSSNDFNEIERIIAAHRDCEPHDHIVEFGCVEEILKEVAAFKAKRYEEGMRIASPCKDETLEGRWPPKEPAVA